MDRLKKYGKLSQLYILDMYCKCEGLRLNYYKTKEMKNKMRISYSMGHIDSLFKSQKTASNIGKRLILSSSFQGSARFYHQAFLDSSCVVGRLG